MKRITMIITVIVTAAGLFCQEAHAKDVLLIGTASASSTYNPYDPDKTVDGDINSYWMGAPSKAPWWIMFDAKNKKSIARINIRWFPNPYYIPTNYDIQISDDGILWQKVYTDLRGINNPQGEERIINRQARYLRLYIKKVPQSYPMLKELSVYEVIDLPRVIRFQGKLSDKEEAPLEGAFTLTFRLYDTPTGGIPLWSETQSDINIEKGILDVELGSVRPFDFPFIKQYWLGVEVAFDGEMSPRFKLTAAPYALRSEE